MRKNLRPPASNESNLAKSSNNYQKPHQNPFPNRYSRPTDNQNNNQKSNPVNEPEQEENQQMQRSPQFFESNKANNNNYSNNSMNNSINNNNLRNPNNENREQTFNNNNNKSTNQNNQNQNMEPEHKTSQKHKNNPDTYKINPKQIPRPNPNDQIYKNPNDNNAIFQTNVGFPLPHSTSFYCVKETENSSCRFLRSSLTMVPNSENLLESTNLMFCLTLQPFAEIPSYESQIPKIETFDNIFRCTKCHSYINNKYKMGFSKTNKQITTCNICKNENDFDMSRPGMKNEYLNTDKATCGELIYPTIDFKAPPKFNIDAKQFNPHYIFLIDISKYSYDIGLPSYIINSIQSNYDNFHNKEQSYIAISLYDSKNIYFFYYEKNDFRLSIMADLKDPFCPISMSKLFLNVTTQREELDKLIEKINAFINEKISQNTQNSNMNSKPESTPTGAAIKSGICSLVGNGGRVLVFTPNPSMHGYAACVSRDNFNAKEQPEKVNVYYPQHKIFHTLADFANENKVCVDQFIFMSTSYDLSTMSLISCLTGGHVEFYMPSQDMQIVNSSFEKMHFDVTRIISRPNYYDVKFMIRFSEGIDCIEILGGFNKKLGEAFQIASCDPDYLFAYNLRLKDSYKVNEKIDFQIACLYIDNYGQRYIRLFNSSYYVTNEIGKIYISADVDTMTKGTIMREINLTFRTSVDTIRKRIEDKIINSFKFYRVKEKSDTPSGQLILPISIRYMPLYIDSFIKKGILSRNKPSVTANQIIYLMCKFMREPLFNTIKLLYPKFYRIDDIETYDANNIKNVGLLNEEYNIIQKPYLLPLSKDNIDFDSAYLFDDGDYISIFIFDQIQSKFYYDLFGVSSWEEAKQSGITSLNEENQSDLNQRILNIINQLQSENNGKIQPVRLFFYDEKSLYKNELTSLLVEDKYNDESCYSDFLAMIHNQIQSRIDN